MGGEKKTNGDANQVDKERNRRASIFLPITPLEDQHIPVRLHRNALGIG